MKKYLAPVICAAFAGMMLLSAPAVAQQKTAKVCADEWKANKDANQAAKITEKAYVAKCRADSAAATPAAAPATPAAAGMKPAAAPSAASGKSAKACADEWKANKDANQAAKITEKAYVAKCRSDSTAAAPAATPASATPAPATAAAPAKPAMAPMAAPAAKQAAAPATGQPAGAKQYAAESQAKAACPSATVVWANLESKIYHFASHKDYGTTKKGAYMCETDAEAQGMRAAKNEKHP